MHKAAHVCLWLALAVSSSAVHAINKNELISPPPAGGVELTKPQPPELPRDAKGAPKKDARRAPPSATTPAPRPPQPAPIGRESR